MATKRIRIVLMGSFAGNFAPHPETAANGRVHIRGIIRKHLPEKRCMIDHKIVQAQKHFKFIIELKKTLKQILLGPKLAETLAGSICTRIFVWKANIMNVNNHPGSKARQNFKVEIINIAPGLYGVTGIYKQDIIFLQ